MNQKTIKKSINFSGVGIHTGKNTKVILHPLSEDSGIIFKRTKKVKLDISNITDVKRAISIGNGKNIIRTIEHLIAAIFISGITNILIEVDNEEIPIFDGSAKHFLKLIEKAGIKEQKKPVSLIKISDPIFVINNDKFIGVIPSQHFGITYHINFPHPDLNNKVINFDKIDYKIFKREIAPARTFGFYKEVQDLLNRGFARGGSLYNTVVLTETGYLNKRCRFKDECLRHKVLDLIGCIGILGVPIIGHFIAYRSGHSLDFKLIKKIASLQ